MATTKKNFKLIDSHTGGEPTRVLVEGCPDLGTGTLAERREILEQKYDWLRTACVREPRGFEAMVGAVLTPPHAEDCVAGVIFFNNAGYLNMCIHGTIGVAITLQHIGLISEGEYRIDTPVGVVTVHLHGGNRVTVDNVPSYLYRSGVTVDVPRYGSVTGDICWGGNWFFLVDQQGPELDKSNIPALTDFTLAVMNALAAQGITGADGQPVDHIEVFGAPVDEHSDSRNFVMCPGGEYDRSPCGTGTSAKLASLYYHGKLQLGQLWRQSSILNTIFSGKVSPLEAGESDYQMVIPSITGSAWVNGETTVIMDPSDPFVNGIK